MAKLPKNPGEICATCCHLKLGASPGAQAQRRAGKMVRDRITLSRTIYHSIPFGRDRCKFHAG